MNFSSRTRQVNWLNGVEWRLICVTKDYLQQEQQVLKDSYNDFGHSSDWFVQTSTIQGQVKCTHVPDNVFVCKKYFEIVWFAHLLCLKEIIIVVRGIYGWVYIDGLKYKHYKVSFII